MLTNLLSEYKILPVEIRQEATILDKAITEKVTEKKYSKKEINDIVGRLEKEMRQAAANLDFERATELRDTIFELKGLN